MDPYNPIIAAHAQPRPRARWIGRVDVAPRAGWLAWIDAWPAGAWLALQAAALWPAWRWAAARLADGSDDPLGVLALGCLVVAALAGRLACRDVPRWTWLAAAIVVTLLATAALGAVPPLAHALLATTALACAWAAWRAPRAPVLPVLGLLWLALPLVASLQFYAGYPLRALTAAGSAALLQAAGVAAQASGASMVVDARLVLVDAPCSGVQLAWFAYATACAAALWRALPDRAFVRRLPLVGLVALAGNVLRNTVLVAHEAGALGAPAWLHDAVGLLALAGVCAIALRLTGGRDGLPAGRDAEAGGRDAAAGGRDAAADGRDAAAAGRYGAAGGRDAAAGGCDGLPGRRKLQAGAHDGQGGGRDAQA